MREGRKHFGAYELVRRLGAGGMAETFVAVRRGPGGFEQHVCLKRILEAFESDAQFVRLFLEEARLSARLRHANIAQVLDFGVVGGRHFLALELIDGLDLKALLQASKREGTALEPELVCHVALELATALDFAHQGGDDGHEGGIVHRDISPSNVLVSKVGEVKLVDFGIAKALARPSDTRTGRIKGKAPYMPPEYARGGLFDARSDLFALGVTLYQALAGQRPFDGANELETLTRIEAGDHVPLAARCPDAPTALTTAVERLIEPNPDNRFASASALLDALVDAAPPPTARRQLGERVRHHLASDAGPGEGELALGDTAPDPPELSLSTSSLSVSVDVASSGPVKSAPSAEGAERDTAVTLADLTRLEHPPVRPRPPHVDVRPAGPDERTRTRAARTSPPAVAAWVGEPSDDLLLRDSETEATGNGRPEAPVREGGAEGGGAPVRRKMAMHGAAALAVCAAVVASWILAPDPEEHADGGEYEPRVANREPSGAIDSRAGDSTPRDENRAHSRSSDDRTGTEDSVVGTGEQRTPTRPTGDPGPATARPPGEARTADASGPGASPTSPTSPARRQVHETTQPRSPTSVGTVRPRDSTKPEHGSRRNDRAHFDDAAHAELTVIVVPFGDVWIDGEHRGQAPFRTRLDPGSHAVATGTRHPTHRTTIALDPGARKRIVLRRPRR